MQQSTLTIWLIKQQLVYKKWKKKKADSCKAGWPTNKIRLFKIYTRIRFREEYKW